MRLLRNTIQFVRLFLANRAEISDDQCVACDCQDLTRLSEAVYRCNQCGYEGGSGYASWKQSAHTRRLLALPPEARMERARENLLEAQRTLLSGSGDLGGASSHSNFNVLEGHASSATEESEIYQQMNNAARMLMEAEALIRDACILLYGENGENSVLDTKRPKHAKHALEMRMDSALTDLTFWTRELKMTRKAKALQHTTERTLSDVFGVF